MKNDENGLWSKSVILAPGKYEYKFLIDGEWKEDPGNKQNSPNVLELLTVCLISQLQKNELKECWNVVQF